MNTVAAYPSAFVCAALATAASVPCWRRWCLKSGIVDEPGHRKIHSSPVPLGGGMAVMTGLLATLVIGAVTAFAAFPSGIVGPFQYGLHVRVVQLAGLTAGALGMLWIGWRDDKTELSAHAKFSGQLVAALMVALCGIRVTLFVPSLPFSYGITVLWILTVVNAVNFMDNMNGLCAGLGVIGAASFGAIAGAHGQYLVATMAFATAGSLAGFLPSNFPRATIFLGDSGSHLTGYLLAVMAILPHFYTRKHPYPLAILTPLLVLAVPLGDLVWVVFQRWRSGQPFYVGDTGHLSHRLVRRGLTPLGAVVLIWLLAAGAGASAFLLQ